MAGTKEGGLKAAASNKERHGDDFYRRIGSRGGSAPAKYPKGFAANPELASRAGAKGGRMSRRGKRKPTEILVDHQEGYGMPELVQEPISTDGKRHLRWSPF